MMLCLLTYLEDKWVRSLQAVDNFETLLALSRIPAYCNRMTDQASLHSASGDVFDVHDKGMSLKMDIRSSERSRLICLHF